MKPRHEKRVYPPAPEAPFEGRLVCGVQAVREAIRAHGERVSGLLLEDHDPGSPLDGLRRFAEGRGIPVQRWGRGELDRLTNQQRHQGCVAYAPPLRFVPLEAIEAAPESLVVALDELEDPQNFGAIVRSSVALGAKAILFPEHHAAPLTPSTFRASAGAVEHALFCKVSSLPRALEELRERGFGVVGLDANGSSYDAAGLFLRPVVVVVGAEGKGLRKSVRAACTDLVTFPLLGPVESLNASVAAGIALHEVQAQRRRAASST
jgi:23S rRNA (guanosine2251-2'-O)-methyltransferase